MGNLGYKTRSKIPLKIKITNDEKSISLFGSGFHEIQGEIFNFITEKKTFLSLILTCKGLYYFLMKSSYAKNNNIYFVIKNDEEYMEKVKVYLPMNYIVNVNVQREVFNEDLMCFMKSGFFPNLKKIDISGCVYVNDETFKYFKGCHTLNMSHCNQTTITDKAFQYLEGIHTLNMMYCNQISNRGIKYLKGINNLNMCNCKQTTITDVAFETLQGIKILNVSGMNQITDEAFKYLNGLKKLYLNRCSDKLSYKSLEYIKDDLETLYVVKSYQFKDEKYVRSILRKLTRYVFTL